MTSVCIWVAAGALLVGPPAAGGAADAVTLRGGSVVLGEVVEPAARPWAVRVRRAWAREHLPEWADRWEVAEAPALARARAQRRGRLAAWARERAAAPAPAGDDRISPWIERELKALEGEKAAPSPLLTAVLSRGDVKSVARAPRGGTRLLRLGWVAKLPKPEGMTTADLKEAVAGRGFDPSAETPVSVDALLPTPVESDAAWLSRRAATEVLFDPGLRFLSHQGVVLPEPPPGQGEGPAGDALKALKNLLGNPGVDPLAVRLREVAARGRVGAMVTRLDVAPDMAVVAVEATLWVRRGREVWVPSGSRLARVRPADLGSGAGADLVDDPQVALALRAVEAIGLGAVPPEVKQRALGVGAATRKALGMARTAAEADLSALALPVLDAPGGRKAAPEAPDPP